MCVGERERVNRKINKHKVRNEKRDIDRPRQTDRQTRTYRERERKKKEDCLLKN